MLWGGGWVPAFCQISTFYYLVGFLLHFVVPRVFRVKDIQKAKPPASDVLRDAVLSVGPLIVKASVWTALEWLEAGGWTQMYGSPPTSPTDWAYLVVCWMVLDYLHDAWFYLTHRLLHWKPLYRHIHYIHHKSTSPTPFTGYSFHPLEAALVFANEILVCFLFPVHTGLHRVYHIVTTAVHEGGHAGYEMAPFIPTLEGGVALLLGGTSHNGALNTVQHHDMHHRYPTRHFSLYFTHWDRWLGTLHPKYEAELFWYFKGGPRRTALMAATAH